MSVPGCFYLNNSDASVASNQFSKFSKAKIGDHRGGRDFFRAHYPECLHLSDLSVIDVYSDSYIRQLSVLQKGIYFLSSKNGGFLTARRI